MAASDVSIPQDGAPGHVKLHPYLITLVRWCVSCLWSTATVILHRLVTTPLPPITAPRPAPRPRPRAPGSEHLRPEPLVECVALHSPPAPALDVIFVHGLYGSLGNTWRQGDWRTKYKLDPTRVPLRDHSAEPCGCSAHGQAPNRLQPYYDTHINEHVTFNKYDGCFQKILPNKNSLYTENFYNNTLIHVGVDNYESQAKFVTELFKNDCDKHCDRYNCSVEDIQCNYDNEEVECDSNCKCEMYECRCKVDGRSAGCAAGCGCVCDACYSPCWPRDWIKEDFPAARVISINYTSDPYLWRPLWVKGNKRLRLHERADQMMEQLLQMGVGQRPIVWVGHSKGGLFIKQIYCEAYEAYLKMKKNVCEEQSIINNNIKDQSNREYNKNLVHNVDSNYRRYSETRDAGNHIKGRNENCKHFPNSYINNDFKHVGCTQNDITTLRNIDEMNQIRNNNNSGDNNVKTTNINDKDNNSMISGSNETLTEMRDCAKTNDVHSNQQARCEDTEYIDISVRRNEEKESLDNGAAGDEGVDCDGSSNDDGRRASLWRSSSGFMFYSVPHRGSPLALFKTPITSRSIELLEIAKDSPLLTELHARWLAAAAAARPAVRSLVETGRTLMSVLWLTIVSEDSADAGVGSLHGVSVDHREICKPASRACPLYTELADLIRAALHRCHCH